MKPQLCNRRCQYNTNHKHNLHPNPNPNQTKRDSPCCQKHSGLNHHAHTPYLEPLPHHTRSSTTGLDETKPVTATAMPGDSLDEMVRVPSLGKLTNANLSKYTRATATHTKPPHNPSSKWRSNSAGTDATTTTAHSGGARSAPDTSRSGMSAAGRMSVTSRFTDPQHTSRYLERHRADPRELHNRPGFGSFYKSEETPSGPGSYELSGKMGKGAPAVSMGGRFTTTAAFVLAAEKHSQEVPDPGAYEVGGKCIDPKRTHTIPRSSRNLSPRSYRRSHKLGRGFATAGKSTFAASGKTAAGVGVMANAGKVRGSAAFSFGSSRRF